MVVVVYTSEREREMNVNQDELREEGKEGRM